MNWKRKVRHIHSDHRSHHLHFNIENSEAQRGTIALNKTLSWGYNPDFWSPYIGPFYFHDNTWESSDNHVSTCIINLEKRKFTYWAMCFLFYMKYLAYFSITYHILTNKEYAIQRSQVTCTRSHNLN